MNFHLGKPILVMLVLAAISSLGIAFRSSKSSADTTVWSFVELHIASYRGDSDVEGEPPAVKYTRETGKSVDFLLVHSRAEDVRLVSMFMSNSRSEVVPDAVEIEIGSVGKFFRPPVNEVGFYPLNDFLNKTGWYERVVKTRFAPYSKKGVIFGVPHDVHPTTISYRRDLFDEAHVNLASAKTWPEFRDKCLEFQRYWKAHGRPRIAMGLSRTAADIANIMLLQRHVNVIDDDYVVHINDPKVAQTIRFNADLVAGPDAIGADFNPAPGQDYQDVARGDICGMITPDWSAGFMKNYAKEAAGKIAMIQLPIFDSGDAPTASWGGTMIGIPRNCKDPATSFKLIEYLYLDHDAIDYRRKIISILPPIREYWLDPIYQLPDPYYADNQKVNQLFIKLADQIPPQYITPFTTIARGLISDVLNKAVARIDAGETEDLDRDIQHWLDAAADDLSRRIKFGTFED